MRAVAMKSTIVFFATLGIVWAQKAVKKEVTLAPTLGPTTSPTVYHGLCENHMAYTPPEGSPIFSSTLVSTSGQEAVLSSKPQLYSYGGWRPDLKDIENGVPYIQFQVQNGYLEDYWTPLGKNVSAPIVKGVHITGPVGSTDKFETEVAVEVRLRPQDDWIKVGAPYYGSNWTRNFDDPSQQDIIFDYPVQANEIKILVKSIEPYYGVRVAALMCTAAGYGKCVTNSYARGSIQCPSYTSSEDKSRCIVHADVADRLCQNDDKCVYIARSSGERFNVEYPGHVELRGVLDPSDRSFQYDPDWKSCKRQMCRFPNYVVNMDQIGKVLKMNEEPRGNLIKEAKSWQECEGLCIENLDCHVYTWWGTHYFHENPLIEAPSLLCYHFKYGDLNTQTSPLIKPATWKRMTGDVTGIKDQALSGANRVPGIDVETDGLCGATLTPTTTIPPAADSDKLTNICNTWKLPSGLGERLIHGEKYNLYCDIAKDASGLSHWTLAFKQNINSCPACYIDPSIDLSTVGINDTDITKIANLYSVLHLLDHMKGPGGFEFKMKFPNDGLEDLIWNQYSNPMKQQPGEPVEGYVGISLPYSFNGWGGLERSSGPLGFLDGAIKMAHEHYVIGAQRPYKEVGDAKFGFPGPQKAVTSVELYVRPAVQFPPYNLVHKKCPRDCMGHGVCHTRTGKCTCNPDWKGKICQEPVETSMCTCVMSGDSHVWPYTIDLTNYNKRVQFDANIPGELVLTKLKNDYGQFFDPDQKTRLDFEVQIRHDNCNELQFSQASCVKAISLRFMDEYFTVQGSSIIHNGVVIDIPIRGMRSFSNCYVTRRGQFYYTFVYEHGVSIIYQGSRVVAKVPKKYAGLYRGLCGTCVDQYEIIGSDGLLSSRFAPSQSPTTSPTMTPTQNTNAPSKSPTTGAPSYTPTAITRSPSGAPSKSPTTGVPTVKTRSPSYSPTTTPTWSPTPFPSNAPTTQTPTKEGETWTPTFMTFGPTFKPTESPTGAPSQFTDAPTRPTKAPTIFVNTTISGRRLLWNWYGTSLNYTDHLYPAGVVLTGERLQKKFIGSWVTKSKESIFSYAAGSTHETFYPKISLVSKLNAPSETIAEGTAEDWCRNDALLLERAETACKVHLDYIFSVACDATKPKHVDYKKARLPQCVYDFCRSQEHRLSPFNALLDLSADCKGEEDPWGFTGDVTCPLDCSYPYGKCVDGKCVCDKGHTGFDCAQSTVCAVPQMPTPDKVVTVFESRYALLDGTNPSSAEIGCQDMAYVIPDGWQVASDIDYHKQVAKKFKLGTTCIVYSSGKAYYRDGRPCGENQLITSENDESGTCLTVASCNKRILITQREKEYSRSCQHILQSNPQAESGMYRISPSNETKKSARWEIPAYTMTFYAAEAYCKSIGGSLLKLVQPSENAAVQDLENEIPYPLTKNLWIGLRFTNSTASSSSFEYGTYQYVQDGALTDSFSYFEWAEDQDERTAAFRPFVAINRETSKWYKLENQKLNPICELFNTDDVPILTTECDMEETPDVPILKGMKGWTKIMSQYVTYDSRFKKWFGFFPRNRDYSKYSLNPDSPKKDIYSIMHVLDWFKLGSTGFEFQIRWPGSTRKPNTWTQSSNPVRNERSYIKDFVQLYCPTQIKDMSFSGLSLSTNYTVTYLDGTPLPRERVTNVYYSLGSYQPVKGGIVGGHHSLVEKNVELWVRTPNMPVTSRSYPLMDPSGVRTCRVPCEFGCFHNSECNCNNGKCKACKLGYSGHRCDFWRETCSCMIFGNTHVKMYGPNDLMYGLKRPGTYRLAQAIIPPETFTYPVPNFKSRSIFEVQVKVSVCDLQTKVTCVTGAAAKMGNHTVAYEANTIYVDGEALSRKTHQKKVTLDNNIEIIIASNAKVIFRWSPIFVVVDGSDQLRVSVHVPFYLHRSYKGLCGTCKWGIEFGNELKFNPDPQQFNFDNTQYPYPADNAIQKWVKDNWEILYDQQSFFANSAGLPNPKSFVDSTYAPSASPTTAKPSMVFPPSTFHPTHSPSGNPTNVPTIAPTIGPSLAPTVTPTVNPTLSPTTRAPTTLNPTTISPTPDGYTYPPTTSTGAPSAAPTQPTKRPTPRPTPKPTGHPSMSPTTKAPSTTPTQSPSASPTGLPSRSPSLSPTTTNPTTAPTKLPTTSPTIEDYAKPPTGYVRDGYGKEVNRLTDWCKLDDGTLYNATIKKCQTILDLTKEACKAEKMVQMRAYTVSIFFDICVHDVCVSNDTTKMYEVDLAMRGYCMGGWDTEVSPQVYRQSNFNDLFTCPRGCSGHGTCKDKIYECVCEPGWGGDDCSADLRCTSVGEPEPKNVKNAFGTRYAVLDNASPDFMGAGCQTLPLKLPAGWRIADDVPYHRQVLQMLSTWSTECLVFANGKSYSVTRKGEECAQDQLVSFRPTDAATDICYNVATCNSRILIYKFTDDGYTSCEAILHNDEKAPSGLYYLVAPRLQKGVAYEYFDLSSHFQIGRTNAVDKDFAYDFPNFASMEPKTTGRVYFFDISKRLSNRMFGMRFVSSVYSRGQKYRLYLKSTGSSLLYMNGKLLLNNAGLRNGYTSEVVGDTYLEPGQHDIVVEFQHQLDTPELEVSWKNIGDDLPKETLSNGLSYRDRNVYLKRQTVVTEPELYERFMVECDMQISRTSKKAGWTKVFSHDLHNHGASTGCITSPLKTKSINPLDASKPLFSIMNKLDQFQGTAGFAFKLTYPKRMQNKQVDRCGPYTDCTRGYTFPGSIKCTGSKSSSSCIVHESEAHETCQKTSNCRFISYPTDLKWAAANPGMVMLGNKALVKNKGWTTCRKPMVENDGSTSEWRLSLLKQEINTDRHTTYTYRVNVTDFADANSLHSWTLETSCKEIVAAEVTYLDENDTETDTVDLMALSSTVGVDTDVGLHGYTFAPPNPQVVGTAAVYKITFSGTTGTGLVNYAVKGLDYFARSRPGDGLLTEGPICSVEKNEIGKLIAEETARVSAAKKAVCENGILEFTSYQPQVWTQQNNPFTSSDVTDYVGVSVPYPGNGWRGLALPAEANIEASQLSGSLADTHFLLGNCGVDDDKSFCDIAGPQDECPSKVELWVQAHDSKDIPCPGRCSGNGICDSSIGKCTCHHGWSGDGCQFAADTLTCSIYGGTHYSFFSGKERDFQLSGEFNLIENAAKGLHVQVRQEKCIGAEDVCVSAVAAKLGDSMIQIEGTTVFINGATIFLDVGEAYTIAHGKDVVIRRLFGRYFVISSIHLGVEITLLGFESSTVYRSYLKMKVPASNRNAKGLCRLNFSSNYTLFSEEDLFELGKPEALTDPKDSLFTYTGSNNFDTYKADLASSFPLKYISGDLTSWCTETGNECDNYIAGNCETVLENTRKEELLKFCKFEKCMASDTMMPLWSTLLKEECIASKDYDYSMRTCSDCSGHGTCDDKKEKCVCEEGWMGLDCSFRSDFIASPEPPVSVTNSMYGYRYASLDFIPAEQKTVNCQSVTPRTLPAGWVLVTDEKIHTKNALMYPWGADCLILASGKAIMVGTGLDCGDAKLAEGTVAKGVLKGQKTYAPKECDKVSYRVLIMRFESPLTGSSCEAIKTANPDAQSGYYRITPALGETMVFCDMGMDAAFLSGWTRVFYHNIKHGLCNSQHNYNGAPINNKNPSAKLISLLNIIKEMKGTGGFYFKLRWPGTDLPDQTWIQSNNPVDKNTGTVTGYRPVDIAHNDKSWGGLEYNGKNTLLDGSTMSDLWFFSVCPMTQWNECIPGPSACVKEVELYVKKFDTFPVEKCLCNTNVKDCKEMNFKGKDIQICVPKSRNPKTCDDFGFKDFEGFTYIDPDTDQDSTIKPLNVYCDKSLTRVFTHDFGISRGYFSEDVDLSKTSINEDSPGSAQYSILKYIEKFKGEFSKKYEFHMRWNEFKQGLKYELYVGTYSRLPGFNGDTDQTENPPLKTGLAAHIHLSYAGDYPSFVLYFDGYILVSSPGVYKFQVDSNDGCEILINRVLLMKNKGVQPVGIKEGSVELGAGFHFFTVKYFQLAGEAKLNIRYQGPDSPILYPIPDSRLYHAVKKLPTQIWAQTSNLVVDETVAGYASIDDSHKMNSWIGLKKSKSGTSFVDGSDLGYYAIGATGSVGNGGFFGPAETLGRVELFVKPFVQVKSSCPCSGANSTCVQLSGKVTSTESGIPFGDLPDSCLGNGKKYGTWSLKETSINKFVEHAKTNLDRNEEPQRFRDKYMPFTVNMNDVVVSSKSATYEFGPGLANRSQDINGTFYNFVSFESTAFKGWYLKRVLDTTARPKEYVIKLERNDGSETFAADATFILDEDPCNTFKLRTYLYPTLTENEVKRGTVPNPAKQYITSSLKLHAQATGAGTFSLATSQIAEDEFKNAKAVESVKAGLSSIRNLVSKQYLIAKLNQTASEGLKIAYPISSAERTEATINVVSGLSNSGNGFVSFQSQQDISAHIVGHAPNAFLSSNIPTANKADATFKVIESLASIAGYVSFESVAHPGFYLVMDTDKNLALRAAQDTKWKNLASWEIKDPLQDGAFPDVCTPEKAPKSCHEIFLKDVSTSSGRYWIDPDGPGGDTPIYADCDMSASSGLSGWTKVFVQDFDAAGPFRREVDLAAASVNEYSIYESHYSLLNKIRHFKGPNGFFEFKMDFFTVNDESIDSQIWAQKSDPTVNERVVGLQSIDSPHSYRTWNGLRKAKASATSFMTGSDDDADAGYVVGAYEQQECGMYGPLVLEGKSGRPITCVAKIALWVKPADKEASCVCASGEVCVQDGYRTRKCAPSSNAESCKKLLAYSQLANSDSPTSGIYWIDVDGDGPYKPVQVYCDFDKDKAGLSGWTRVFFHDIRGGYFDSPFQGGVNLVEESVNTLDPHAYKFSILNHLERFRGAYGFEFSMRWNDPGGEQGLHFTYYEVPYSALIPDTKTMFPVKSGVVPTLDINSLIIGARPENFVLKFTTKLYLPVSGVYDLFVNLNGGGELWFDSDLVVKVDGVDGRTAEGYAHLSIEKGFHDVEVIYHQIKGDSKFLFEYSGPGISRQVPSADMYFSSVTSAAAPATQTWLQAFNPVKELSAIYIKVWDDGKELFVQPKDILNVRVDSGLVLRELSSGGDNALWRFEGGCLKHTNSGLYVNRQEVIGDKRANLVLRKTCEEETTSNKFKYVERQIISSHIDYVMRAERAVSGESVKLMPKELDKFGERIHRDKRFKLRLVPRRGEGRTIYALDKIVHQEGYSYRAPVPVFGDWPDQNDLSECVLYEDGFPMGAPHSDHKDIIKKGKGLYSHYNFAVFFSANRPTENPLENNRLYTLSCPDAGLLVPSWKCVPGIPHPVHYDGVNIECPMEVDSLGNPLNRCQKMCPVLPSAKHRTLTCGSQLQKLTGTNGYDDRNHWCSRARAIFIPTGGIGAESGYADINVEHAGRTWNGLLKETSGSALLTGSFSDPYFTIAAYKSWKPSCEGFAGPSGCVKQVSLWVRESDDPADVCNCPSSHICTRGAEYGSFRCLQKTDAITSRDLVGKLDMTDGVNVIDVDKKDGPMEPFAVESLVNNYVSSLKGWTKVFKHDTYQKPFKFSRDVNLETSGVNENDPSGPVFSILHKLKYMKGTAGFYFRLHYPSSTISDIVWRQSNNPAESPDNHAVVNFATLSQNPNSATAWNGLTRSSDDAFIQAVQDRSAFYTVSAIGAYEVNNDYEFRGPAEKDLFGDKIRSVELYMLPWDKEIEDSGNMTTDTVATGQRRLLQTGGGTLCGSLDTCGAGYSCVPIFKFVDKSTKAPTMTTLAPTINETLYNLTEGTGILDPVERAAFKARSLSPTVETTAPTSKTFVPTMAPTDQYKTLAPTASPTYPLMLAVYCRPDEALKNCQEILDEKSPIPKNMVPKKITTGFRWLDVDGLEFNTLPAYSLMCLMDPDAAGYAGWTRVFAQDVMYDLFENPAGENRWDPSSTPILTHSEKFFSRLEILHHFKGPDGFRFKIVYPGSDLQDQIWIQTSNPITDEVITGFEPIHLFHTEGNFSGLRKGCLGKNPCVMSGGSKMQDNPDILESFDTYWTVGAMWYEREGFNITHIDKNLNVTQRKEDKWNNMGYFAQSDRLWRWCSLPASSKFDCPTKVELYVAPYTKPTHSISLTLVTSWIKLVPGQGSYLRFKLVNHDRTGKGIFNVKASLNPVHPELFEVKYPFGQTYHALDELNGEAYFDLLVVPGTNVVGMDYTFYATIAYSTGTLCKNKPHYSLTNTYKLSVESSSAGAFNINTRFLPPLEPSVLRWVTVAFITGDVEVSDIQAVVDGNTHMVSYVGHKDYSTFMSGASVPPNSNGFVVIGIIAPLSLAKQTGGSISVTFSYLKKGSKTRTSTRSTLTYNVHVPPLLDMRSLSLGMATLYSSNLVYVPVIGGDRDFSSVKITASNPEVGHGNGTEAYASLIKAGDGTLVAGAADYVLLTVTPNVTGKMTLELSVEYTEVPTAEQIEKKEVLRPYKASATMELDVVLPSFEGTLPPLLSMYDNGTAMDASMVLQNTQCGKGTVSTGDTLSYDYTMGPKKFKPLVAGEHNYVYLTFTNVLMTREDQNADGAYDLKNFAVSFKSPVSNMRIVIEDSNIPNGVLPAGVYDDAGDLNKGTHTLGKVGHLLLDVLPLDPTHEVETQLQVDVSYTKNGMKYSYTHNMDIKIESSDYKLTSGRFGAKVLVPSKGREAISFTIEAESYVKDVKLEGIVNRGNHFDGDFFIVKHDKSALVDGDGKQTITVVALLDVFYAKAGVFNLGYQLSYSVGNERRTRYELLKVVTASSYAAEPLIAAEVQGLTLATIIGIVAGSLVVVGLGVYGGFVLFSKRMAKLARDAVSKADLDNLGSIGEGDSLFSGESSDVGW